MAVGTDDTATSAAHTGLQAEITTNGLERSTADTISQTQTTVGDDTLQFAHEWTADGGDHIVEEIGVFNASSGATMLGRSLTGTKTINDGETLSVIYQIIFS